MRKQWLTTALNLGLLASAGTLAAGCSSDRPQEYGDRRPPVDQLADGNSGLQAKDVVTASELMARDLLANARLRQANEKWVMVVDRFEDRTLERHFNTNYDIFIERTRVKLAQLGQGTVALVENKARLANLRNRELDGGPDGSAPADMARLQPDFALYAKAMDMPNRRTNYYLLEFTVVALKNTPAARAGEQVWTNAYEVQVER